MKLVWVVLVGVVVAGYTVFFGAPYVPSRRKQLNEALDKLAKLKKTDHLLDLGSGDGVVLRAVVARGARATGYEMHPLLVVISKLASLRNPLISVKIANIWHRPFPDDTTIVYVFGDSRDIARFARRIEQEATRLGKVLRVISYGFEFPDWKVVDKTRAHFLYEVRPLHATKPQV